MKRSILRAALVGVLSSQLSLGTAFGRGFGGGGLGGGGGFRGGGGFGGGGGIGGGGFHGGGGFSGGGGLSGGGFRPSPAARPSFSGAGGGGLGGLDRAGGGLGGLNRPAGGLDGGIRPNAIHTPGQGGGGLQLGDRPQINPGGGITRTDLNLGNRTSLGDGDRFPGLSGGTPGIGGHRPENFPGLNGPLPDRSTATLPGLGGPRPGADGGRLAGAANRAEAGNRLGQDRLGEGGAGTRWTPGQTGHIEDRANDLSSRFDDHWGDSGWHNQQWTGPNGGEINHVGFWGPNGYWGHTGAWGPNGGHWGHSTGIGPNGAWGHTVGWGPNGNVWGHGGAVGPNGAFGWAGYCGPAGHWSRNWGGWYNGYAPAWGHGRWDYLWDTYPVAMAFGATMWGINAINYAFGVGAYSNPYYSGGGYVDYSQPIVGDPSYAEAPADGSTAQTDTSADNDPVTTAFNQAREAFKSNQFQQALDLTNQALKAAPRDAAINEFRSLCLFALGQYRESAATIHAVLAAGPGWDWTTLISLYGQPDTYTEQVRKLEDSIKANPKADEEFLLAYHYITQGHQDDAVALLQNVVKLQPDDKLAAELVQMYQKPSSSNAAPPSAQAQSADDVKEPAWPLTKLEGIWTARDDSGVYMLSLKKDESFTWEFTRNGKPQSVSGAYVVRGKNLVMQPNSGGVMLSDIDLTNDSTLVFTPIGDATKLQFTKS